MTAGVTKTPTTQRKSISDYDVSWSRGNMGYIEEVFGYTINMTKDKPTNSGFLAMLRDKIYHDLRKD